ncbi:hypothetical protein MESS2_820003 [Mesorhizobium metallidurans STM 2683]|uniref:Uncharacterized protein n=1 Tax=Mesorhizobium metallidurans STM 2683 TaxID=1297569 RepID=M5EYF5_9HYPH|nr:hypothetical protein MESS2_820003 [Mesorhizobium metallidurans STM 2683]
MTMKSARLSGFMFVMRLPLAQYGNTHNI